MVECCFAQSRNLINKCANLKEVVSLNPLPPVIHESGRKMGPYFVHITDQLETAVLRVPKGSEELYRADAVWGEFKNIQGFDPGSLTASELLMPSMSRRLRRLSRCAPMPMA